MEFDLENFQVEKGSIVKILDFLPYPFLLAEERNFVFNNTFVNKKFIEEIGYTCDDIPTINDWFDKAYPDTEYRNQIKAGWTKIANKAIAEGKDSLMMQAKITTKFNKENWYEVKSSIRGNVQFVAFININEALEREQELKRINENKNKILSILGHDLRAPIANINTLTEFALSASMGEEEFFIYLNKLQDITKNTLDFLETTLIWTKNNFEKLVVKHDKIPLYDTIQKIITLYKDTLDKKKIYLQIAVNKNDVITSDIEILRIVLRNLISNSIKFTPEGGNIAINSTDSEREYYIKIKDNGIGMKKELLNMILEDKFDFGKTPSNHGGYGLGLRLCKDVLHSIGGRLDIVSSHQTGTDVTIILNR